MQDEGYLTPFEDDPKSWPRKIVERGEATKDEEDRTSSPVKCKRSAVGIRQVLEVDRAMRPPTM